MYIQKKPRGEKFRITVVRSSIEELDQAIKDLSERGFTVVDRGIKKGEFVIYTSTNKKHSKYEFSGTTSYDKAWARLEKIN